MLHPKIAGGSESENVRHIGEPNGRYANYFMVGHNSSEFVLDFGQIYADDVRPATIHTRIIMTPVYAKALLELLQDSVAQHEQMFGDLPIRTNKNHIRT